MRNRIWVVLIALAIFVTPLPLSARDVSDVSGTPTPSGTSKPRATKKGTRATSTTTTPTSSTNPSSPPTPPPTTDPPSTPTPPPTTNPPSPPTPPPPGVSCSNRTFLKDPLTGRTVIRLTTMPAGWSGAHNIGYYRNVWNADESYMIIAKEPDSNTFELWLFTGDGCEVKKLWSLAEYSWMLGWDAKDPKTVWTSKSGTADLYKINVDTLVATKVYTAPNQIMDIFPISDTRLLLTASPYAITLNSDGTNAVYYPASSTVAGGSINRVYPVAGTPNKFAVLVDAPDGSRYDVTYNDSTGMIIHTFGPFYGNTNLALHNAWDHEYFANNSVIYANQSLPAGSGQVYPLEIHIANLDGTNDRILYSESDPAKLYKIRSFHHNWYNSNSNWFLISVNPAQGFSYDGLLWDQFLKVGLDGTIEYLGRNPNEATGLGTPCGFWALSLGNMSKSGTKIDFNSCRSGITDNYILYLSNPPQP